MCTSDECARPTRRFFLARALGVAAAAMASVRANAARLLIESREITFRSAVGDIRGYLATPAAAGRHGAIVLMHGEFALPETHRETADELACAGFVTLAVQRFSRMPGMSWKDLQADDNGEGRFRSGSYAAEELEESRGAIDWLGNSDRVRADRVGAVGFCGGGIRAIRLAAQDARIRCVAAFYPPPQIPAQYKNARDPAPDLLELSSLPRCPMQIHFGSEDYIVKKPDVERLSGRAREGGARVEIFEYSGAGHAFYDRTDSSAYRARAAAMARRRYLEFLRRSLR